jgi:voltage-gated sodium channel
MQSTVTNTVTKIVKSYTFQVFIICVILFSGLILGLETFPSISQRYEGILYVVDHIIIWIFIGEMLLKLTAEGDRPWRYFQDGWNLFDFLIVASFFLPVHNHYLAILRLARILRVLKLIRALPRLQLLTATLLRSIPSMGYICVLMMLLFYTYGVLGTFLFAHNDPLHFGDLPISVLSLFRVVTLEDWTDIMYIQMYGCDRYGYEGIEHLCTDPSASLFTAPLFFVSFVVMGSMIIINLFIGVMVNSFAESKEESKEEQTEGLVPSLQIDPAQPQPISPQEPVSSAQFLTLQRQLSQIQRQLEQMNQSQNNG